MLFPIKKMGHSVNLLRYSSDIKRQTPGSWFQKKLVLLMPGMVLFCLFILWLFYPGWILPRLQNIAMRASNLKSIENIANSDCSHMDVIDSVDQVDVELFLLWESYKSTSDAAKKAEVFNMLLDTMLHRRHLDESVNTIGSILFGLEKGKSIINSDRAPGFVDDSNCLKSVTGLFVTHCGQLGDYGFKHIRAFANICNARIPLPKIKKAFVAACDGRHLVKEVISA